MTEPRAPRTARELGAEYIVLTEYDTVRGYKGHDYGAGQRATELMRRRRLLDGHGHELSFDSFGRLLRVQFTPDELEQAFERVGRRRVRRAELDAARYGSRGVRLTYAAWLEVAARYSPAQVAAGGES